MNEGRRNERGGLRVAPLWLPLLLAAAASCAQPVDRRARLRIAVEPGVDVPGMVDRVRVGVAATTSGLLECRPIYREFTLARPAELPILIDYFPGEHFDFGVAFRLEWYKSGVMVAQREINRTFPADGIVTLDGTLPLDCFTTVVCGPEAQCFRHAESGDVVCSGLSTLGYFTDPCLIEPGARACDDTEVLDAGGDVCTDDAGSDAGG